MFFTVSADDPDVLTDNLTMWSNLDSVTNFGTYTVTGSFPITMNITLTPSGADIGKRYFTISVEDDACDIIGSQFRVYIIDVELGTDAGEDKFFCTAGDSTQLLAVGGCSFTWTPATGLSSTNIFNPKAAPTVTTTYTVVSDLGAGCSNTDSVTVYVVSNYLLTATSDTDTICKYGATNLLATPSPSSGNGFSPYTYSWTPSSTLSNSTIANPLALPLSTTTYTVTVISDSGCILTDSVTIVVSGEAPQVTITGDSVTCIGDTVQLVAVIAPNVLTCDTILSCLGSTVTSTVGTGAGASPSLGPFYQRYPDIKFQQLFDTTDLQNAGVTSGAITEVGWYITEKFSTLPYDSFTISMGCTPIVSLGTNKWETVTKVYNASNDVTTTGWNMWRLDYPFEWTGSDNLVVQVCYSQTNDTTSDYDKVRLSTSVGYYSTMFTRGTFSLCDTTPSARLQNRANTRFVVCSATPTGITYSWSPTTGLYSSSSTQPDTLPNPMAIITSTNTSYTVTVNDGQCEGSDFIVLGVENTLTVTASVDTLDCNNPLDSVQLNAIVSGDPPPGPAYTCADLNTVCTEIMDSGQIGTGTLSGSANISPFQSSFGSNDMQVMYLYRAEDFNTGTLPGPVEDGTITGIGFKVDTLGSSANDFEDFQIELGCTDSTNLSKDTIGGIAHFNKYPTTKVWGPSTISTTGSSWNMFYLDSTFDWDGTSNIVMYITWCNAITVPSGSDAVYYSSYIGSNDKVTMMALNCSGSPAAATDDRPNTRFIFCPTPDTGSFTYSWAPADSVTNPSIANPKAKPHIDMTYTVTVTGGPCVMIDSVTIYCNVLPITLVVFEGEKYGEVSILHWETQSEVNSDYFDVQRSSDGELFETIGIVKAAGNSSTRINYKYVDEDPLIGLNYYRLKMVDFDEKFEYSNVIALEFYPPEILITNVYPNPTNDLIYCELINPEERAIISFEIVDILGKTVVSSKVSLNKGAHNVSIDLSNVNSGLYFIRVSNPDSRQVAYKKFIKE